jgi:hypothetical protein
MLVNKTLEGMRVEIKYLERMAVIKSGRRLDEINKK